MSGHEFVVAIAMVDQPAMTPHRPSSLGSLMNSPRSHRTFPLAAVHAFGLAPFPLAQEARNVIRARTARPLLTGLLVAFVGTIVAGLAPALAATIFQQDFQ